MTTGNSKTVAIILAGGSGERMKAPCPKQFLPLAGEPIISHTLRRFDENNSISDIVIVCHEQHVDRMNSVISDGGFKKIYKVVPGGLTRQASSCEGVKNCPDGTEFVLIHDAVRPFVTKKIIKDVLQAAKETGAAGAAIDTVDTIIFTKGDFIKTVPERDNVKRIQTPQGFRYKIILESHIRAVDENITDITDDCGLVLSAGYPVKVVEGSVNNIKITDETDLFFAGEALKKSIDK